MKSSCKSLKTRPKAIDLFSGAGGLTCGLRQAGFQVIGAVEIDDLAVEAYTMNHPAVTLFHKNIEHVPSNPLSSPAPSVESGADTCPLRSCWGGRITWWQSRCGQEGAEKECSALKMSIATFERNFRLDDTSGYSR
jgi:hypothetical protein